jgi:hypothetical protein
MNDTKIFQHIRTEVSPGTRLPGTNYVVKGFGKRRGEDALVYTIPNTRNPRARSEKGVAQSEWRRAQRQLMDTGELSRAWFSETMRSATAEPCNFTVIGKVFVLLGLADYKERGRFVIHDTSTGH